jgi:hypothetical protein
MQLIRETRTTTTVGSAATIYNCRAGICQGPQVPAYKAPLRMQLPHPHHVTAVPRPRLAPLSECHLLGYHLINFPSYIGCYERVMKNHMSHATELAFFTIMKDEK